MTHEIVAFVFARGGSKGLPRKNLLLLKGKPLIVHAIELGNSLHRVKKVVVSTDSEEIAEVARNAGAEVPFLRPDDLSTDGAPEWLAWRHAINALRSAGERVDIFLSLPPTSPLRSRGDVEYCLDAYLQQQTDVVVTVREAERNPYFNMVRCEPDGLVKLAVEGDFHRRQDAPTIYDLTTVAYVARADFVLSANHLFEGKVRAVLIPRERALDIDLPLDMVVAHALAPYALGADAPRLI